MRARPPRLPSPLYNSTEVCAKFVFLSQREKKISPIEKPVRIPTVSSKRISAGDRRQRKKKCRHPGYVFRAATPVTVRLVRQSNYSKALRPGHDNLTSAPSDWHFYFTGLKAVLGSEEGDRHENDAEVNSALSNRRKDERFSSREYTGRWCPGTENIVSNAPATTAGEGEGERK